MHVSIVRTASLIDQKKRPQRATGAKVDREETCAAYRHNAQVGSQAADPH
jgi:hypothetical protein